MYVCLLVPTAHKTRDSHLFQLFAWVKEFNIRKSTWYRFLPLRLVNESLETETAWVLKGLPASDGLHPEVTASRPVRNVTYRLDETPRHSDTLRSERHRHANIHFFAAALPPLSLAQTWWCFLLLINMKTHKTFDGVENHRRCFLCLKWARGSGRRKERKARRERWKQKFNDNSPDLNV